MKHFLQSDQWRQFQEHLGRECISDHGDGWSYHAYLESSRGNSRLYVPYGPTAKAETAFTEAIASLTDAARKRGATFVRVEPTTGTTKSWLKRHGFKPVTYQQLNPARTQVIDLTVSRDDLLADMSQNSRNITRNYAKKGVTITSSSDPADIDIFIGFMKRVAARNRITPHSASYMKAQAESLFPSDAARLYVARFENKPIAAALVFDSETTRYYAHAAADDAYRKLSAGTALVGQMILDAKERGQHYFDLYGIAPADSPTHPWHGLTRFKQSFGGKPVDYLGSWDLPLRTLPYSAYRHYQSLRKRLRR